jgi:malonate-semialdehyde dehydrogenase (acetylating)/methylmalonate-semialdehyde dehydrogenase
MLNLRKSIARRSFAAPNYTYPATPAAGDVYEYKNYINGKWVKSNATEWIDQICPLTQRVLGRVPQSTDAEFNEAVENCQDAFESWKMVSVPQRVRHMLTFQELLKVHQKDLAETICWEHGKPIADGMGDVFRGYEIAEHACSFNSLMQGETMNNVSTGIDIQSYRVPLGVCAGITPYNFPAMVPLWMYPLAITAGNTFLCKPSERVPMTSEMIVDMLSASGVPAGVVNIVHGGKPTVDNICDHELIKAVSFVGANHAGEYIYTRASANGKRAQVNMGAKNHCIVLPDADKEDTLNAITGACFGSTGQRCMAISVVVLVGEAQQWVPDLVEKASKLKCGPGHLNMDIGPTNNRALLANIERLIADGEKNATLLLDGRNPTVEGYPDGNWIGATIIDGCEQGMACYDEEIFGPVMCIVRKNNLEDAIKFVNENPYGNGVACFSANGHVMRKFQTEIEAGQIGINLPIPVPLPMFSFTGNKASMWGTANFYGKAAVNFYTSWKTITARWKEEGAPKYDTSTSSTFDMK